MVLLYKPNAEQRCELIATSLTISREENNGWLQVSCGVYPVCLKALSAAFVWSVQQGALFWVCISDEDTKMLVTKGLLKLEQLLQ